MEMFSTVIRLPDLSADGGVERPKIDPGTSSVRGGAASVDYILGLGVVLPLLLIAIPASRRIMQLVFEFAATMAAWPFM